MAGSSVTRPESDESTQRGRTSEGRARDEDLSAADEWAERERRRRRAWLEGPSEDERRAYARSRRRASGRTERPPATLGPTQEEVDEWAEREHRRRQAWVDGPSEDERIAWARSRRRAWSYGYGDGDSDYFDDLDDDDTMRRVRRDMFLARVGALHLLANWPFYRRSKLIRAGREWESDFYDPYTRRRVPYEYYED